jgi:hypothetical protein
VVGKDMPSLEVRAGRGGRPPLSSRDRELGRDGSSGAILCKAPSVRTGGAFFVRGRPAGRGGGPLGVCFGICGGMAKQIKGLFDHDGDFGT